MSAFGASLVRLMMPRRGFENRKKARQSQQFEVRWKSQLSRNARRRHGRVIVVADTADGAVIVTFEIRPVALPVIVALHPGKLLGRKACNVIASIYAKDFVGIEEAWKKRGLLLWEQKRKCPAGVTTTEALIAKCGTTP